MAKVRSLGTARGRLGGAALLVALVALSLGGVASSPAHKGAHAAAAVKVSMGDNFFKPGKAKVRVGGKVRWTNNGQTQHNVTFGSGGFSSGNLAPGEGVARRFKRAGRFSYVCTLHTGMKGTVKVVR
jgi:plastocyanin